MKFIELTFSVFCSFEVFTYITSTIFKNRISLTMLLIILPHSSILRTILVGICSEPIEFPIYIFPLNSKDCVFYFPFSSILMILPASFKFSSVIITDSPAAILRYSNPFTKWNIFENTFFLNLFLLLLNLFCLL